MSNEIEEINYTDEQVHTANQRLINEAYAHLTTTGVPSVDKHGHCTYSGIGCALAPAIKPDRRATLKQDSAAVSLLTLCRPSLEEWALPLDKYFAREVQVCHDHSIEATDFLEAFKRKLKYLCKSRYYTYPGDKDE